MNPSGCPREFRHRAFGLGPLGVIFLGLVLALAGCGGGQPGGTYELQNRSGPVSGVRLILRSNGTYRQDGFPAMEGRWERKDKTVTLRPETAGGRTAKEIAQDRAAQGRLETDVLPVETLLVEDGGRTLRPANGFGLYWRLKARE